MTVKKLHYVSGLLLTVFTGIHLCNHICSIWGIETHINVMERLRPFYRNVVIETLILSAVAVQILSGAKLLVTARTAAFSRFERLQLWTGLYLAAFFVIHVGSVLIGRLFLNLDTNFYYGAAGLNTYPFSLFFIPYYGLATLAFFGHAAAIHNQKMQHSFRGWTPTKQAKAILVLGFLVTAAMFFGLTNRLRGINVPAEYNVLIGK